MSSGTKQAEKIQRPNIISFSQPLYGLKLAFKPVDILWPCHAFVATLPCKKRGMLNIFEETILKLTAAVSEDMETLADITCMNKELVIFIRNRLHQLRLLDERFRITGVGLEQLRQLEAEPEDYVQVTLYVDLMEGSLLPVLNVGDHVFELIRRDIDAKDDWVSFEVGPTGNSDWKKARLLRPPQGTHCLKVPDSAEILKTIKAFKKRYMRYSLLNDRFGDYPPFIPKAEAISVIPEPELIFLHCLAVFQEGCNGWVITDGFGYGFSEHFTRYIREQNYEWLHEEKKKGLIDTLGRTSGQKIVLENFSEMVRQYPKLYDAVKEANDNFKKAERIKVDSSHGAADLKRKGGNTITDLYSAVEQALLQVVSDKPVDNWKGIYRSQNHSENDKLLTGFARRVGFKLPRKEGFLQVKGGAIEQVSCGKADMQPLLALAMAGAVHNLHHPLVRLAGKDPDCLLFLSDLKKDRDAFMHGSGSAVVINIEKLKTMRDRVYTIIKILFPELDSKVPDSASNETDIDDDSYQMWLKATLELEKEMGIPEVALMDNDLREELLKLFLFDTAEEVDCRRIINSLYAALQRAIWLASRDYRQLGHQPVDAVAEALKKASLAGFELNDGRFPESIGRVRKGNVESACSGFNATVGANLLALLLLYPEDELQLLAQRIPDLISLTDNISGLRGHGNISDLRGHGNLYLQPSSKDEITNLRTRVLEKIKILMEETH